MNQDNTDDRVEIRKYYYSSGALWHETPYVNGKVHGIKKEYEMSTLNIVRLTLYDKDLRVASVKSNIKGGHSDS